MANTIPQLFRTQAERLGDRTLFLVKRAGKFQPVSWRQADDQVEVFAAWLLEQGIQPGDRILLLCENRPEWGIIDLAIQSVGAWTVPVYPSLTVPDLTGIAQDCQPRMGLASTSAQLEKLLAVRSSVASLKTLILLDGGEAGPGVVRWPAVLEEGRRSIGRTTASLKACRDRLQPEATCTLIYTSGTTGEPKGVMLSHRNFLSNVEACRPVIPVTASDTHLSFLPLCHVFERMAGWYLMLHAGATVAYAENMDTIPEDMREVRPTIMLGVPRFFEKLRDRIQEAIRTSPGGKRRVIEWALRVGHTYAASQERLAPIPLWLRLRYAAAHRMVFHKLQARLGGRLRFFVSGGAPLSPAVARFFFSLGVTILEGYGLTETSPVIAVNRLPVPRFGSVGQVISGVEVRIAEDGEILTRGPHIMQGYYQKPEATREVIVDGWFHTGDIGRLDAEGYLSITDRKKDLIKTASGKFVAPQKLEGLLMADPWISQAFVYGDRRPYCVALIVPKLDQLRRYAQEQEISAHSPPELINDPRVRELYWAKVQVRQQHLASFEQVKRIALLDAEFSQASGELTPTLKAKRQIIAARHEPLLRSLYESVPTEGEGSAHR